MATTQHRHRAGRRHLPPKVAFYLQASIVLFFLAASSAPTPLYATYSREWGFSPITTTVVFGVYAFFVLGALLVVGSLSDHVGRRPVLLGAIVLQATAMVVFATAGGVPELIAARVVQGLSAGAAVGAIGAGLLDIDRVKGTLTNAVAPVMGTASGGIISGLLVTFLPAPTHLVYLVLLGIFAVQLVGVLLMAETSSKKAGALASLKPQVSVPSQARRPLMLVAPVLVAVWSLAGFYGAIAPAVARVIVGSGSALVGGLPLFVLAGSGALVVPFLQKVAARTTMVLGTSSLIVGVGLTLGGVAARDTTLFFAGTAVAGVGFGAGFQGAIRSVVPLAAAHERSGLLSAVYVISYLAMGLPAVVGGLLVVHGGGLITTTYEYGAAAIVLALPALVGVARRPRVLASPEAVLAGVLAECPAGARQLVRS